MIQWALIAFYTALTLESVFQRNYPKAGYWVGAIWITLCVRWMR